MLIYIKNIFFILLLIFINITYVVIVFLSFKLGVILIQITKIADHISDNSIDIMYPHQFFCKNNQHKIVEWCKQSCVDVPKFYIRDTKTLLVSRNKESITQIALVFGNT